MPTHRLIPKGRSKDAEWLLEWDATTFALKNPDGRTVFEESVDHLHRRFNLWDLYVEGKFSLPTGSGSLLFEPRREVRRDLRGLVEQNLRSDADYRSELKVNARRAIPGGLAAFLIGGGLFGIYCWVASWAPDPPPGHWIRWFGPLIHLVLCFLMAYGIAGPIVFWFGLRQYLRIRRIERDVAASG